MLDEKLKSLRDHKEKWYDSDGFRIHTESENILENPRGDWKWDGWKVTGRRYWRRGHLPDTRMHTVGKRNYSLK